MHKSQVFLYILISFILGVFAGSFWSISDHGVLILCLVAILVIAISGYERTFSQSREGVRKRKLGLLIGCLILVFTFGVFRFNQFNLEHSQIMEFADDIVGDKSVNYVLQGYVASNPENKAGKTKFIFRAKKITVPGREIPVDDNILITANLSNVKFGDSVIMTAALATPKNFQDFDYVSYLKKDGIRFIINFPKDISVQNYEILSFSDKFKIFFYKPVIQLKNKFESAINNSISEPQAGFINGILLGNTANLSQDLKESFNKTGTSHILAISGYNIAIISWAVMWILIWFFPRRKAFWFSVAIIVVFTIMTGASSSVVRASVMGLLLLFAQGYGRLYDPKNSILFAGALMIFENPLILRLDIGFQLSFLAVLGLMYIYPIINHWTRKLSNAGHFKDLISATISAQIAVFPLLVYYFHNFSLISLPANILILPFVPAAMFLGFLSGIGGMFFLPIGRLLGYFAWAVTKYQTDVIENLASFSHAWVAWNLSLVGLLLCYALIIFLVWRARILT